MENVYTCETCGLVTTNKGHLCNPVPAKKVVSCKFCGTVTGDPRHVCAPQIVNLKYICDSCGRLASKTRHALPSIGYTKTKEGSQEGRFKKSRKI